MVERFCPVVEPKDVNVFAHKFYRLNQAHQFHAIRHNGHTCKMSDFIVCFLPQLSGGLGFAVKATKKNFKKAHDRNFVKRRMRHLIYTIKPEIHGHILLIAHKSLAHRPYHQLIDDFMACLQTLRQHYG